MKRNILANVAPTTRFPAMLGVPAQTQPTRMAVAAASALSVGDCARTRLAPTISRSRPDSCCGAFSFEGLATQGRRRRGKDTNSALLEFLIVEDLPLLA